eukprot:2562680-Pyramimonas_sp.AAC.1
MAAASAMGLNQQQAFQLGMAGFANGSGMGQVNIKYTGAGAYAAGSSPGGVTPLQQPGLPPMMPSTVEVPAALPVQDADRPPCMEPAWVTPMRSLPAPSKAQEEAAMGGPPDSQEPPSALA